MIKFQIKDIWASIGTVAHAQEHVIEKCYNVVQQKIMPRSQTKKTRLQTQKAQQKKKSTNKKNSPEASTTAGKKTPSRKNPAEATRKRANDKNAPKPKRAKTTSATEGRPLTTADIPDIVAAFADANLTLRETPVQAKKSRHAPHSGSNASPASRTRSRLSRDDSPSGDSQPSSDEDNDEDAAHEEFGKYIHTIKCTLYYQSYSI